MLAEISPKFTDQFLDALRHPEKQPVADLRAEDNQTGLVQVRLKFPSLAVRHLVHTILVTFALRQEGVSFERRLTQRIPKFGSVLGRLDSQEVAVSWLGIGARNQERFRSVLTDFRPELVINSGFAGAVRTLLEPGDFVLAENFSSA